MSKIGARFKAFSKVLSPVYSVSKGPESLKIIGFGAFTLYVGI